MKTANFTFLGNINDFLPHKRRNISFVHEFDWRASIKDAIESFGVPHPEIEAIFAGNASVDFDYIVEDLDKIRVYSIDAIQKERLRDFVALRPPLQDVSRFVLDTHLGRLASYLRMMGFDTLYRNDYPDDELAEVSHYERRILLTRDIGLLKRKLVDYGYFVRNTNPTQRLHEIVGRFNLAGHSRPFRFCMKCNGLLYRAEKNRCSK